MKQYLRTTHYYDSELQCWNFRKDVLELDVSLEAKFLDLELNYGVSLYGVHCLLPDKWLTLDEIVEEVIKQTKSDYGEFSECNKNRERLKQAIQKGLNYLVEKTLVKVREV